MRYLIFLQLVLLVFISSCGGGAGGVGSFLAKGDAPAVTSVDFANDQLIINGSNLAGVTSVSVEGEDFDVESISETQLVVNAQQALAFIAGATYNLLVSNAFGAASYSITFTPDNNSITTNMIVDSAITTNKIADEAITESKLSDMGASDGDFLQWDQTTTSWIPTTLNGLTYMGTWDASSGSPPTDPGAGGYYIVSVAGDTDVGTATDPWSVGDWVIRSDSEWQKIDNSNAVTNVFGRQGAITGVEGDYNIDLLGDVDTTTATPADGQVLTWDQAGGNWVPATESDPKVGTLTNGKWCTTDGNVINCESAPGAETDPIFGAHVASSITDSGSGVVISVAERNGITNNASSISTNATNIATNDSDIATNVTNISTNATNISSNDTDIATNATNISSNDTDIATNVTNISTNATNISSNDTDIATNVTNISTNATNISSNDTEIAAQATAVSGKVTLAGAAGGQTIIGGTADNENLTLISSSATPGHVLLNPAGGNVGIGTTDPKQLLHINTAYSDLLLGGNGANIAVNAYYDGSWKYLTDGYANVVSPGSAGTGSYVVYSAASGVANDPVTLIDRFHIAQNGNVGIGSTSPAAKLDVAGAINAQQLCDENGANCFDLDSGAIAVSGDVSASGGNVSVGTTDATYNITFDGDTNQTIGVLEQSSGAGSSLTINSGAAQSGSTDQAGGNLILSSGSATGSGGSTIEFKTATSGASGTVTATPSTKMVILENGNVGIGTTVPSSKLEVTGAIKATESGYSTALYGNQLRFNRDAGASYIQQYGIGGSIRFRTSQSTAADTDVMMMLANGNVGIGTTSPTDKLVIKDLETTAYTPSSTSVASPSGGVYASIKNLGITNGNFSALKLYANPSTWYLATQREGGSYGSLFIGARTGDTAYQEYFRINKNGNVGIGTTSPAASLEIVKPNAQAVNLKTGTSDHGYISYYTDKDNTNTRTAYMGFASSGSETFLINNEYAGGAMGFMTGAATRLQITNGGDVGIGTTLPGTKLDVQGGAFIGNTGATSTILRWRNADREWEWYANSTDDFFGIYDRTGTAYRMVVDYDGDVGIGTTAPGSLLTVGGNPSSSAVLGVVGPPISGTAAEIQAGTGSTSNILNLRDDTGNAVVVFKESGYVGIGTTSPSYKLDISSETTSAMMIRDKTDSNNARIALYTVQGANGGAIDMWDSLESNNVKITTYGDSFLNGGNVGIGTTNPDASLVVWDNLAGDASDYDSKQVANFVGGITWGGGDGYLSLSTSNNTNTTKTELARIGWLMKDGTDADGNMTFGTKDIGGSVTEKMRITNDGYVGIGTTEPETLFEIATTSNANQDLFVINGPYFGQGNGQALKFSLGGSPLARIRGFNDNDHNGAWDGGLAFEVIDTDGTQQVPTTATTEAMRIDAKGKVGIGITNPVEELDVNGDIAARATNVISRRGAIYFGIAANTSSEIESFTITLTGDAKMYSLEASVGCYGNSYSGESNWKGMISGYSSTTADYSRYDEILDNSDNSEVTMSMSKKAGENTVAINAKNLDTTQNKICYGHYILSGGP